MGGVVFVETGFDAGHERFVVVSKVDDAGSCGSDCGLDLMLAIVISTLYRQMVCDSLCAISRSSRG